MAISVRMEFWHEQLNLYRLLLTVGREPQHKRQTHELLRAGHGYFVGILKEGVEAGEIAGEVDLDTVAWAILDMVRGANERRMDNLTRAHAAGGCCGDYGVRAVAVGAGVNLLPRRSQSDAIRAPCSFCEPMSQKRDMGHPAWLSCA